MIKKYFGITLRNWRKNRAFSALNPCALTVSLTACFIIYFWISYELSYDITGTNADRVFRVALQVNAENQSTKEFAETSGPLLPALINDFPEIEKGVRMDRAEPVIGYKQQRFFAENFFFADPAFFEVFGYPLLKGEASSVFTNTNSAVVTESMAKKIFGDKDPLGEIITLNDTTVVTITGVAKDLPANNHFTFDILTSFQVLERQLGRNLMSNWWFDVFHTYILLKDPNDGPALNTKIADILEKYNAEQNRVIGLKGTHLLQPLRSIHLYSDMRGELSPNGNIQSLRILGWIAGFLLLVASINYVNLTTATSFERSKEIGIKKVAGATSSQLMTQFLVEAVFTSTLSTVLAVVLAVALLPLFNRLAGTQITLEGHLSPKFFASLLVLSTFLGLAAGAFPSFYLSRIKPMITLRKGFLKPATTFSLRKVLVVFQFSITVALIIATIVAREQLRYMQNRDLGFSKEQVLNIRLHNQTERLSRELIKSEFMSVAGITDVTASMTTPGNTLGSTMVRPEGVPKDKMQTMATLITDFNFIKTYRLEMAAGRAFSPEHRTDSSNFIINEAAVKEFGWGAAENAIGKDFAWGGLEGKIIGVVKDFHFNSLQQKVQPILMLIQPEWFWYNNLSVRIPTENTSATLQALEVAWKNVLPNDPFEYSFVDDEFAKQYKSEEQLTNLSAIFSTLIIFISCMGLFGLTMIAVSQRTKEIGIRKVLGASVSSVVTLLSKDFVKLVMIAIAIASPIAWWLVDRWLNDFAYRINIPWWVFAIAGMFAVSIALMTVSFHTIKAAVASPVKSLRLE